MMIPDPWAIKSQLRNFKRRVKIYRTEGSKEILFGSLIKSVAMSKILMMKRLEFPAKQTSLVIFCFREIESQKKIFNEL